MRWEPLTEKKFKTQLMLVSIIVFVLIISGSFLYVSYQKNLSTSRSKQTIAAISSLKVEQLSQWNQERLSEVTFFSTSQSVLRVALPVIAGEKDGETLLKNTLGHILSNNRYEDIAFLDKGGKVLFSLDSKFSEIDTENKASLDRVFQTGEIVFKDFFHCPYYKKPMVFYLAPVFDKQATVVAVMMFLIDPDAFFYPHIRKWPVPSSTAESYLVRRNGDAIDFLSPVYDMTEERLPLRTDKDSLDRITLAAWSIAEQFVDGKDGHGTNVLAFVQPVPGTDWCLISKVSKQELFADYYRIFGLASLFSVTLLLLLWGGIAWVYKKRQQRMYDELYRKSIDLHQSQQEFGATLYSIGEGVVATDEKGQVTRMNQAASRMTGWTETKAKGKPIEDVFATLDENSRLPVGNSVRLVLQQGGKEVSYRNRTSILVSKDGQELYVSESVAPIKDPEGKLYGVVLVFRDQTDERVRKRLVETRLSLFEYATRHDMKETLSFMVERTGEVFHSPLCLFLTIDHKQEDAGKLVFWESENGPDFQQAALGQFKSHPIWRTCLDKCQPVILHNNHDKDPTAPSIDDALVVPVLRDGLPVALLGLANRKAGYGPSVLTHASYLADVVWEITNEKQKESCLLESEDKYRSLVDQMQVGLALHELILENGVPVDYRFLEVNPGFERLTGLTREQLVGKTVTDVMPGTEHFWIEKYGQVVLSGKPDMFEDYSRAIGRYYSVVAYPVGTMRFATIIDDVTEQRHMMDVLRSSEQSYRDLIDNINDTVWIVDKAGNLLDVNKEVTTQLGYSKEEILKIGVKGIDIVKTRDEILQINDNILNGIPQIFETVHRTKNGRLIPVEVNGARVNYKGKQVAVCIARDITQRKRAEGFQHLLYEIASFSSRSGSFDELLTLVRNELGKVMDATNFYVALHQDETNTLEELLFVNEKYSAHSWPVEGSLSGYVFTTGTSVLLCGNERKGFLQRIGIEEVENPPSCWMGVPLYDGKSIMGVLALQHYSDQHAYDQNNLQILEMVAHELSVVIQRQRMISDLIRARDKAEESDRLKTAFLANVSHEIRTPMNGILGFIEMLADPETEQKDRATYLDIVNKSGQRLLGTIDDIVEISRIEAGLVELHPVETDLSETMEYLYSFFQAAAQEKGITLVLEAYLKGEEALIIVDKFKLDGILTNLLNNAVKFTHKGSITFGNTLKDGQLFFYVSDTGIGIPAERQDAVFQRFVQADLTSTRPYEGSGLGLAIVKAYLDKMGGRIWLDSEPGKGSTFSFAIPYAPLVHPIVPIVEEPHAKASGAAAVSVLVAEDDPISFIYLETLLKREGFTVYRASNGLEAVSMAQLHPDLDAILMDIKMPVMNGLEATREIRRFNPIVPIIAQSAYAFAEDRDEAMKVGCTDFLTKPTTREWLLSSLKAYVARLKE